VLARLAQLTPWPETFVPGQGILARRPPPARMATLLIGWRLAAGGWRLAA